MKILVVSDTHGINSGFIEAVEKEQPDLIIHCGDGKGIEMKCQDVVKCPMHIVRGNSDEMPNNLPLEKEVEVEGYKIFLAHGHKHLVYAGTQWLIEAGRERGANIVMFGHTHIPHVEEVNGMLVMNPGSITMPRQGDFVRTYMTMEINNGGKIEYELKHL